MIVKAGVIGLIRFLPVDVPLPDWSGALATVGLLPEHVIKVRGSERLREAGIDVVRGVLRADVAEFMRPWLTATRLGRPFVTLKWASSLDGRAAAVDGSSQWITGTATRQLVHEERGRHDAIAVLDTTGDQVCRQGVDVGRVPSPADLLPQPQAFDALGQGGVFSSTAQQLRQAARWLCAGYHLHRILTR